MNDDEQKLFGGLYDSIEDSAIGKFFDLSGEKKAAVDQAKREGKFGVVSKNLQKVVDVIETGIGKAMTPVTKGIELVSDVTNVDERAVGDALTVLFYGKGLVKKLPKVKTPERFKPVNKRTVDVKATRVEDAQLTGDYTSIAEIPNIVAQSQRIPRKVDLANIKALKNKLNNKPFTFQDVAGDATDKQIMQAYRERTGELQLNPTLNPDIATPPLSTPITPPTTPPTTQPINFATPTNITSSNPNFGGDGGFFKKVVQKAFRNKATFPSLFVDPVTLKPKRGFTNFEMASAYDRYIDNLAKKSGYKSLADFKVQVLDTLGPNDKMNLFRKLQDGENLRTGYIEHMVAKASKKGRLERIRKANPVLAEDENYLKQELSRKSRDTYDMDWYWDETYIDKNGVTRPGLNKGDRNATRNVRINFNNRYKALKDVVEQVLYGTEANPGVGLLASNLENRLIVSIEDIDKRSFTFNRTQLGDVVIRRAGDNKLVGKLGNYLDVLYPQNNNAKSLLERNVRQQINPNTGAKFTSLDDFRDYMIRERVGIILDDLPKLSGKSNRQRQQIIDEALAEDLAKLYEDYPFLPKPKYISEITDKGLDQNVIKPPVTESDVVQQELPDIKE